MSFQITILKVLAGQVGGRATRAELTRQVSVFVSSGTDWTNRTKRLAALAPGLNIFASRFVVLDDAGWQITDAGQAFLLSLETPAPERSEDRDNTAKAVSAPVAADVVPTLPETTPPPSDQEQLSEVAASHALPSSTPMRPIGINRRSHPRLAGKRERRSS